MSRPYTLNKRSPSPSDRVLSREEATEIATKLLSLIKDENGSVGVMLEHTARSVTKIANNKVLSVDESGGEIVFLVEKG